MGMRVRNGDDNWVGMTVGNGDDSWEWDYS